MYINKKSLFINLGIIVGVVLIAFVALYIKSLLTCPNPSEEIVKCIANNSILYVQEGCSHCERQQEIFGECDKMLNIIDCTKTPEKCVAAEIGAIPTWIINGTLYKGIYKIDELKNMTGCS